MKSILIFFFLLFSILFENERWAKIIFASVSLLWAFLDLASFIIEVKTYRFDQRKVFVYLTLRGIFGTQIDSFYFWIKHCCKGGFIKKLSWISFCNEAYCIPIEVKVNEFLVFEEDYENFNELTKYSVDGVVEMNCNDWALPVRFKMGTFSVLLREDDSKVYMEKGYALEDPYEVLSCNKEEMRVNCLISCFKFWESNIDLPVFLSAEKWGRHCYVHSMSSNEIFSKCQGKSKLLLCRTNSMDSVIGGYMIDRAKGNLSSKVEGCIVKEFGEKNSNILKSFAASYGVNFQDFILKLLKFRRAGSFSGLINQNWKCKRFCVDLSFILEKMGDIKLSGIDTSINPKVSTQRMSLGCEDKKMKGVDIKRYNSWHVVQALKEEEKRVPLPRDHKRMVEGYEILRSFYKKSADFKFKSEIIRRGKGEENSCETSKTHDGPALKIPPGRTRKFKRPGVFEASKVIMPCGANYIESKMEGAIKSISLLESLDLCSKKKFKEVFKTPLWKWEKVTYGKVKENELVLRKTWGEKKGRKKKKRSKSISKFSKVLDKISKGGENFVTDSLDKIMSENIYNTIGPCLVECLDKEFRSSLNSSRKKKGINREIFRSKIGVGGIRSVCEDVKINKEHVEEAANTKETAEKESEEKGKREEKAVEEVEVKTVEEFPKPKAKMEVQVKISKKEKRRMKALERNIMEFELYDRGMEMD